MEFKELMRTYVLWDPPAGARFAESARAVIEAAREANERQYMLFNDTLVQIEPNDNPAALWRQYQQKRDNSELALSPRNLKDRS